MKLGMFAAALVLAACSSGKPKATPEAEAYLGKLKTVLAASEELAGKLGGGKGRDAMRDCASLRGAVESLEKALKDVEGVTAAPAGLTGCFASASKVGQAIRGAAPAWVTTDMEERVKLCFALTDPGVTTKVKSAVCNNAKAIAGNCEAERKELETTVAELAFKCP
ncbi:MAG: hypothetical protein KIT31_22120 [Deltaproteobacteria bacterium]|nr:hypothetical protein [Deltaproteobacteria bacterium]